MVTPKIGAVAKATIDYKTEHMNSTKTPLFSTLRKLVTFAADNSDIPTRERLEHQNEIRLSRRNFLLGTGMLTSTLLLETLPANALLPLRKNKNAPRIVIIGGGIAGLTAAWTLRKHGIHSTVYEATPRIGGRMFTGRNIVGDNVHSELGGEFVDTIHTDILKLVKEFGISLDDIMSDAETLLTDKFVFNNVSYSPDDIVNEMKPHLPALQKLKNDVFTSPEVRKHYDNISAAKLLEQLGIDGWLYTLFDTAYTTELGLDIGELSSLQILELIPTAEKAKSLLFFNDSDERFKIHGGSDALATAMAKKLGSDVQRSYLMYDIQPMGNRYKLTFDTSSGSKEIIADFVICTIPFTILRQLKLNLNLSPLQQKAIKELSYGTNAKLIMGMKRPFWRDTGISGTIYTDPDLQLIWDSSRMQETTEGAITMLYGGERGRTISNDTEEYYASQVLPKLDILMPGATKNYNQRVKRFTWANYKYTFGSYSCYTVGQQTTIGGNEGLSVGNLYFAGEHCSKRFQGFMNGAAETGRNAAEDILRKIKK